LNNKESAIYDLTRVQPQAYWSVNHLLMRLWDDTKQEVAFVTGDEDKAKLWQKLEGQAEFIEDKLILTSMPRGKGILRLRDSKDLKNFNLSVQMKGNKLGSQGIYVRADETLENYIFVQLKDNVLKVYERLQGKEKLLVSVDLEDHDSAIATPGTSNNMAVKDYKPAMEIKDSGSRLLTFSISEDELHIFIDEKPVVSHLKTLQSLEGYVYLEAAWSEGGYSQRNLADDVYDGIFESLMITTEENKGAKINFDTRLHGWDKLMNTINEIGEGIINWFIRTL
jgi:hypothetical protein